MEGTAGPNETLHAPIHGYRPFSTRQQTPVKADYCSVLLGSDKAAIGTNHRVQAAADRRASHVLAAV
jgi:hypothetical protein